VHDEGTQQQGCGSSEFNARDQQRTKTRILEDAIISVGFHIAESQQSHDLLSPLKGPVASVYFPAKA
jgi:hypothetical protein